jgi:hypothetical protein
MVRVTNYFDTQVRVPNGEEVGEHIYSHRLRNLDGDRGGNAAKLAFQGVQGEPTANRKMSDEQIISWYGKILDSVRLRYRKLQRFARYGEKFMRAQLILRFLLESSLNGSAILQNTPSKMYPWITSSRLS